MDDAKEIIENFKFFTHGIRVLYLIDRTNSNTNRTSSRWVKKVISSNPEEYIEKLKGLLQIREPHERIYASVNARNFSKAVRAFKYKQLDNEYMSEEQNFNFYRNIYNNWISALAAPQARDENYFLLDLDSSDIDGLHLKMSTSGLDKVIYQYQTQKGWHVIVEAFNPSILQHENLEIKKDALLLLKF